MRNITLNCRLIAAAILFGAGAVGTPGHSATVSAPTYKPEIHFSATWDGVLPETLVPPAGGQLPVRLENKESRDILVRIDVSSEQDGVLNQFSLHEVAVPAGGQKSLRIPLKLPGVSNLKFAGKLIAQASGRAVDARGETSHVLPHLYYHPADGGLRFYSEKLLRSKYGAGNFQQTKLDLQSGVREFGRAAIAAGLPPNVEPVVARVSHALPLDVSGPPSYGTGRRFCVLMPGGAYNDSSNRVWVGPTGGSVSKDYGEDYGRAGQAIPMARAWVSVAQAGGPLYSGFLDAAGCTPELAAAPNIPALIAIAPLYLHTGRNIRGFVADTNLGSGPAAMPLFFLFAPSANSQTNYVLANFLEYAQTIYAAAAQGMERFHGGSENVLYEWRIRAQGDNNGTATGYAGAGHPVVLIKFSTAAQSKFTVVHEYGHAILLARANPPMTESDIDYTVEPQDDDWQHTLDSKEWQLVAAFEGFAHMVAAVTWNDTAPNSGAVYVDGSDINPNRNDPYSLGAFSNHFLSNFNPAVHPGQGVELDWAQFFWNYYTDTPAIGGVPPPSQSTLMSIFMASQPWPVNEGFFDHFSAAAAGVLPPTMPIPGPQAHQWFLMLAAMAGIIN